MARHNKIGEIGEDIAARYLENKGFDIIERNFRRPWGELDIIAKKRGVVHFVEVKTVSSQITPPAAELRDKREMSENAPKVSHETNKGWFQPEDAVHPYKQKRLKKAIESYLPRLNRRGWNVTRVTPKEKDDIKWQFGIIAVFLDMENKAAKVRFNKNLVL